MLLHKVAAMKWTINTVLRIMGCNESNRINNHNQDLSNANVLIGEADPRIAGLPLPKASLRQCPEKNLEGGQVQERDKIGLDPSEINLSIYLRGKKRNKKRVDASGGESRTGEERGR